MPTTFEAAVEAPAYLSAKKQLLESLRGQLSTMTATRPASPGLRAKYEAEVKSVADARGRELFYPSIGSGAGNGALLEFGDGSVKYDLITGIGVHFFGHGNLDLFEAEIDGAWCDVMQGNLCPNPEYGRLMKALLGTVGERSRLKHVWLTTCGAVANEIALKIVRQKKHPASKILAFSDCFAGRTTAMQELTDNPKYREGQPTYGEVAYLPYFDPKSRSTAAEQAQAVVLRMREELGHQPGRFAAIELELVQGEGGFRAAPREFVVPVLDEARKQGLYVWIDEVQTFGRTGEIWCYQRIGLDEYVDVVTAAKLLQTAAVIYTAELNPKAGLVSGTFAGSTVGMRAGLRAIELLKSGLCGPGGRVQALEKVAVAELERIKAGPHGRHLVDFTVIGGMIAFTIFDASLERAKKFLFKLWDLGAMAFYCGHGPYRVRMLPPFGNMTAEQVRDVFARVEQAISETA